MCVFAMQHAANEIGRCRRVNCVKIEKDTVMLQHACMSFDIAPMVELFDQQNRFVKNEVASLSNSVLLSVLKDFVIVAVCCGGALRVFPGGDQVDGLPPAPSTGARCIDRPIQSEHCPDF